MCFRESGGHTLINIVIRVATILIQGHSTIVPSPTHVTMAPVQALVTNKG